ncbi:MAG TPA: MFS transporter, partial [Armatimonadota bacterium]|nr:MFS transporter [Armatimonadota bacterium]
RVGLSAMLVMAVLAAFALDRFPNRGWVYAALFALAAVLGLIDLAITYRIPEHPRPVEADPLTLREVVCAFLAGTMTAMMDPFTVKYGFAAPEEGGLGLNVSLGNLCLFILPTLAMAWSAPHWGHLIDRRGPRPVLTLCMSALICCSSGWLLMRPGWWWLIPVLTVSSALCFNGITQVEFYMRSVGFPDFRRSCYLAQLNVIMGLAAVVGTTLGGVLATVWRQHLAALPFLPHWITHYHLLFLTANALRLLLFLGVMVWLPLPSRGATAR